MILYYQRTQNKIKTFNMGLSEIGGGIFFGGVPSYVDLQKVPGDSALPEPSFKGYLYNAALQRHIWASPNLVWLLMSIAMYVFFPIDLDPITSHAAKAPLSLDYFNSRIALWMVVVLGYDAFWHVTIYLLGLAKRPFIKNRKYRLGKVAHNVMYCVSGVVIYVGFENVFAFLWATGRLPYLKDSEAFATPQNAFIMVAGCSLVPLWRDFHFYFAHRMIHFRPLFQQIHSLHHRNTDVEPFSGLCMHPVEHLYYYTSALPSLVLFCSPLHLIWNAVHFLVAPAASHSGYEDHFQADAMHYYHHRYFEVNYAGAGASYLDQWFGTFQSGWKEKDKSNISVRDDAKADLNILQAPPSWEYVTYLGLSAACMGWWVSLALPGSPKVDSQTAHLAANLAGNGPVAVAVLMCIAKEGFGSNLIYPFAKRPLWETLFHIVVGTLFTGATVAYACYLCLL